MPPIPQATPQTIPITRFDVRELPEDERFPVWRESISVIFEVSLDPEDRQEAFASQVTTCHFGPLLLSNAISQRQCLQRPPSLIARDGIDHFLVQVTCRGSTAGQCGRTRLDARPGDVFIIDLDQPLATRTDAFDNLTLVVPRQLLRHYLPSPEKLHGRLLRRESPLARLLSEHLHALWNAAPASTPQEAQAMAEGVAALVASYFSQTFPPEDSPPIQAATASAIRQYIASHLTDAQLTPDRLAARFQVSRSQVYRMFEPFGGVARYVRDQRLKWCLAELSKPASRYSRIVDIAMAAGFTDEAHFCRLFRQAFGASPGEIRGGIAAGPRPAPGRDGPVDRSYEDWVRLLG